MFGKRKRTNTFKLAAEDAVLSGKLTRSGDLILYVDGHEFLTVPGRTIPALAHWLSSVKGRFADVDPTQLQASATVLPLK